ncbi:MAG: lamin tail domain-containing protein [Ignavibacteriaceae bacterium]|nr:lamin tail domain-containing protein [Ignavibacteriaceae bacterium]
MLRGLRKNNFILLFFFLCVPLQLNAQQDTSLTFSEIMFYGASGNNEFIELFNLSYTQTIDLSGYKIKYAASNSDVIISLLRGSLLKPRSYAVIFEGDYDTLSGIYSQLVPDSVLIMRISDNSFGTSGMANTSDRTLLLLSPADDTLEIYTYTANNSPQRSDEKTALVKDNSPENWGNSSVVNGTPGFRNSIMPYNVDLQAVWLTCTPAQLPSGSEGEIRFSAANKGLNVASDFSLAVYLDANNDSLPQPSELIISEQFSNLMHGDSVQLYHTFLFSDAAPYRFIAAAEITGDEFPPNNKTWLTVTPVTPQYSFNELIINEIMYAPSSPEKEWIEIYNRSGRTINLKKWRIADRTAETSLITTDFLLQPQQFAVISDDSTLLSLYPQSISLLTGNLPSLNNDGDRLLLKDSLGIIIDSVTYFTQWGGGEGRSLERVWYDSASSLPANWKSSEGIYKGTPGLANSAIPKSFDLALAGFNAVTEYSIIGEAAPFTVKISNRGLLASQSSILEIYHDISQDSIPGSGELILSLPVSPLLPGDSTLITFTVTLISPGLQRFIAVVNYPDDENTLNNRGFASQKFAAPYTNRGDIIINEIMYAPQQDEPEWIEIYNKSAAPLLLSGFMIADGQDTSRLHSAAVLMPDSFMVITRDSSITSFYNHTYPFMTAGFPALNNTGDRILLLDSLAKILDSLVYSPAWGGSDGLSLERISYEGSSADSANWKTAAERRRATPGIMNSVSQKDFDLKLDSLQITPLFPVKGDTLSVTAFLTNTGRNNMSYNLLIYEDTDNDSLPDLLLGSLSGGALSPQQQGSITAAGVIAGITGKRYLYITVSASSDQDTSDNYEFLSIRGGVPPGDLVINEIMYQPADGEPEWVEVYNASADTIYPDGWKLRDVYTTPAHAVIKSGVTIPPGEYLVLAKDSSLYEYHPVIPSRVTVLNLPTLNNDRDGLSLLDERGVIIDSVFYTGAADGKSLERVSSTAGSLSAANWALSTDRNSSSPGRINSVTPRQNDIAVTSVELITKYPVSGDSLSFAVTLVSLGAIPPGPVMIYTSAADSTQDYRDSILTSFPPGEDSITIRIWNAAMLGESRMTFTASLATADDDIWNNRLSTVVFPGFREKAIVITEIMIHPFDPLPEWVEIYNNSDSVISLDGWKISDYSPTMTMRTISGNYFLAPGEYGVICADSSLSALPWVTGNNYIVLPLPALGNSGDGVFLFDRTGSVIDSVIYTSTWDLEKWYTLERKEISGYSGNRENWYASEIYYGTPGSINSATRNFPSAETKLIINEIMASPSGGMPEYIEFYNPGDSLIRLNYISVNGKRIRRGGELEPGGYFVAATDSSVFKHYSYLLWPMRASVIPSLSLRNDADTLVVAIMNGPTLDSVVYTKEWHSKNYRNTSGRSLEKINPLLQSNAQSSWSTSVSAAGGSPGLENSIFTGITSRQNTLTIAPNPFSPDEDGFEDFTIVSYSLPYESSRLTVYIFDKNGRKVRTLKEHEPAGGSGEFVYDGRDDSGNPLRIGIYILYLEAADHMTGGTTVHKAAFVVARKL